MSIGEVMMNKGMAMYLAANVRSFSVHLDEKSAICSAQAQGMDGIERSTSTAL